MMHLHLQQASSNFSAELVVRLILLLQCRHCRASSATTFGPQGREHLLDLHVRNTSNVSVTLPQSCTNTSRPVTLNYVAHTGLSGPNGKSTLEAMSAGLRQWGTDT